MHFIDRHGLLLRILTRALLEPALIFPRKPFEVRDNAGRFRAKLERKAERIGFEIEMIESGFDFEFIQFPFFHAGNEQFPNAGRAAQPHQMFPAIPVIEIADHADPFRVWRPHSEQGARHAVYRHQVTAEFIIDAIMLSFAVEI